MHMPTGRRFPDLLPADLVMEVDGHLLEWACTQPEWFGLHQLNGFKQECTLFRFDDHHRDDMKKYSPEFIKLEVDVPGSYTCFQRTFAKSKYTLKCSDKENLERALENANLFSIPQLRGLLEKYLLNVPLEGE